MSDSLSVHVRLELGPQSKAAFAAALSAGDPHVFDEQAELDNEHPWLVIADGCSEYATLHRGIPPTAAVIAVDAACPADVRLPTDASPREIEMAVGLCAEIARLRFANHRQTIATSQVRQLAETDPLTGLPNRRAWTGNLEQRLAQARQNGEGLSLGIVDLDRFKRVNDTAGHPQGDEVLKATAAALQRATRAGDLLARLGGDEFAVVLGQLAAENAPAVWERIRIAVADATNRVAGEPVTCSIGYVWLVPEEATDSPTLLAAADAALLEAKRAGRNCVVAGSL